MNFHIENNLCIFECGCKWPIIELPKEDGILPLLDFDPDIRNHQIPFNCLAVWKSLSRGETKGVFQLESPLGKHWTKRLKPENVYHLSALGSILRPGALESVDSEGISATEHYCRRKNNEEEVENLHPALKPILEDTYGTLIFQEEIMRIGKEIAGFNLIEVDMLRKNVGKKNQAGLAEIGKLFLEKAKQKNVVPYEIAETLWNWIQKSGRYLFNASHSYSYGLIGYISAYCKVHFPVQFFCSWIAHAHEKQNQKGEKGQEIRNLIMEAKLYDVPIITPSLLTPTCHAMTDFKKVYFGLADIKGIGESQVEKIINAIKNTEILLNKQLSEFTWFEFITNFADKISPSILELLIKVGACPFNKSRNRMLAESNVWNGLTDKEKAWIHKNNFNDFEMAITNLGLPRKRKVKKKSELEPIGPFGGCSNEKRQKIVKSQANLLKNPPSSQEDFSNWIVSTEEELLGAAITCNRIDGLSIEEVNTSCKDFLSGKFGYMIFGVEILSVREIKCKKGKSIGKNMAFLTISDDSCGLSDVVIFNEQWEEFKGLLFQSNCVLIHGERDKKRDCLIVKKVAQMYQSEL